MRIRLSLASKLTLSFVAVGALLAGLGIFSIFQLNLANQTSSQLATNSLPAALDLGRIDSGVAEFRLAQFGHTLSADASDVARFEAALDDSARGVADATRDYEALVPAGHQRDLFDAVKAKWALYLTENEHIFLPAVGTGANAAASSYLAGEGQRLHDSLDYDVEQLAVLNVDDGQRTSAINNASFDQGRALIVGAMATMMAVVIALGLLVPRSASRSVRLLVRGAAALREREAQLSEAQGIAHVGSWELDLATQRVTWSAEHYRIFGLEPGSVQLRLADAVNRLHPDDREAILALFAEITRERATGNAPMVGTSLSREARLVVPDGSIRWIQTRGTFVADGNGGPGRLVGTAQDITERKQADEALHHQATHDALTDLPNRTLLNERLSQAIVTATREKRAVALLLIDLDRFKEVNDTFGHHHGDLLLQHIGQRLQGVLRASDTLARLGGDEFAVVLQDTDSATAARLARLLLGKLDELFTIDQHRVEISASIGVAMYPEHGTEADVLMRHADVAMYVAKRGQRGVCEYSTEVDLYSPDRLALGGELRRAIDEDQLFLHYQPQVAMTGRLVGVEALVRWRHPRRRIVLPDEFIGLAEHVGLIKPLTRWVLDAALGQCRIWLDKGFMITVAVNVSMHDLHDDTLPDTLAHLLMVHNVAPECLRIEITEGAVMSDAGRALDVLTRIRGLGVSISVDDFGTGYSSLAYLKKLPVDEIKIDKSFVLNLATDEEDASIVRSTITLGQDLGLRVIAEGVENQAAWDRLRYFGCDLVQGYFVSEPLSATDLERWLVESKPSPANQLTAA